jgi:DNA ligase-1
MTFKPMLASPAPETIKFPVLASPKLDGIRCIIRDGVAVSRNLKPIPNVYIQKSLAGLPPLDGELIVGPPVGNDVWNRSNSGVMSRDG